MGGEINIPMGDWFPATTTVGATNHLTVSNYCPPNVTNTGVSSISYWPYFYQSAPVPVECSGDVHVFPCPHCNECKCGGATKKSGKGKGGKK